MLKLISVVFAALVFAACSSATAGQPGACDSAAPVIARHADPATTRLVRSTTASAAAIEAQVQIPGAVGAHVDSPIVGADPQTRVTVCIYSGSFNAPTPPGARQGPRDRMVIIIPEGRPAQILSMGFADTNPAGLNLP